MIVFSDNISMVVDQTSRMGQMADQALGAVDEGKDIVQELNEKSDSTVALTVLSPVRYINSHVPHLKAKLLHILHQRPQASQHFVETVRHPGVCGSDQQHCRPDQSSFPERFY